MIQVDSIQTGGIGALVGLKHTRCSLLSAADAPDWSRLTGQATRFFLPSLPQGALIAIQMGLILCRVACLMGSRSHQLSS